MKDQKSGERTMILAASLFSLTILQISGGWKRSPNVDLLVQRLDRMKTPWNFLNADGRSENNVISDNVETSTVFLLTCKSLALEEKESPQKSIELERDSL